MERGAVSGCYFHNGINYFPKSALRVPCTQFQTGIVHQAIERWCVLRHGAQEQNGKLHQGDQLRMRKIFTDMMAEGGKHVQAERLFNQLDISKFSYGKTRHIGKRLHTPVSYTHL